MAPPSPDQDGLREALRRVTDPASGRDVVAAGMIEAIDVRGGLVKVTMLTDRGRAASMETLRGAVEAAVARHPGVTNASVILTAHRPAPPAPPPPSGPAKLLAGVGSIVAVASGKGGVGKSTAAVNIAVALARQGLAVGLLDADIYGPSLPRMLGRSVKPEIAGKLMIPIEAWGLKAMSIGFLVDAETPMVWRGPMVMGALEQMMGQVDWGRLDVMIVDMPPGTGDAQLTMAQKVSLAGAVIVSTPQDIALIDARRGVRMFQKTRVPILGLIENMSFFCCPECGARSEIFGHGGARAEAAALGVDFLGEVPLLPDVRTASDAGAPIVASAPDGRAARAFTAIAAALWAKLQAAEAAAFPRITVD